MCINILAVSFCDCFNPLLLYILLYYT